MWVMDIWNSLPAVLERGHSTEVLHTSDGIPAQGPPLAPPATSRDQRRRTPVWSKLIHNIGAHVMNQKAGKHGPLYREMTGRAADGKSVAEKAAFNLVLAAYKNIKSGSSYR